MKRHWKRYFDYITNNVIANYETYVFSAWAFCFLAIADIGIKMYRHKTNFEDYSFGLGFLIVAILYGCFVARARAVRSLQDDQIK